MATITSVKGLVALVTGGASGMSSLQTCLPCINSLMNIRFRSSGLGKATVDRLIRLGAKGVVAFDRNIETKFDANVLPIQGSVTSEEDVTKALEQCEQKFGRLDTVVNCAGIIPEL